jgi:hypothetical protein
MNRLILLLILFLPLQVFAQTFFVSGRDNKSREHIIEKIRFEGYQIRNDSTAADYTVQLLMDGQYKAVSFKRSYQGYIKIINNKSGKEIGRTKIIKKNPAALNGYNAASDIFSTIAKKYLVQELRKCSAI